MHVQWRGRHALTLWGYVGSQRKWEDCRMRTEAARPPRRLKQKDLVCVQTGSLCESGAC